MPARFSTRYVQGGFRIEKEAHLFLRSIVLGVLLSMAVINPVAAQITPEGDFTIHFKDEATLTAPEGGDLYFWQIPPGLVNKSTQTNQVTLSGTAGRYQISVSVITAQWDSKKFDQRNMSLSFVLEGSDPTPGPTPNPGPDLKYGFDARSWSASMTEGAKFKTAIADNFDAVAASIAAGAIKTVAESQQDLASRNRQTVQGTVAIGEWTQFFQKWQDLATSLNQSKKLRNLPQDYAEAYRETAKGLR